MTNSDIIILLIFILCIVFIGEVFTEENIHIVSQMKKREIYFFDNNEKQGQNESSSHLTKDTPEGFHIVSIRYENGRLKAKGGIYRNQDGTNVRHGEWCFWSEDGIKIADKHYKHGVIVSTKKY